MCAWYWSAAKAQLPKHSCVIMLALFICVQLQHMYLTTSCLIPVSSCLPRLACLQYITLVTGMVSKGVLHTLSVTCSDGEVIVGQDSHLVADESQGQRSMLWASMAGFVGMRGADNVAAGPKNFTLVPAVAPGAAAAHSFGNTDNLGMSSATAGQGMGVLPQAGVQTARSHHDADSHSVGINGGGSQDTAPFSEEGPQTTSEGFPIIEMKCHPGQLVVGLRVAGVRSGDGSYSLAWVSVLCGHVRQ